MDFIQWQELEQQQREDLCQKLNPFEEWDLFKCVENEFIRSYGGNMAILEVFCGIASGVGPMNAITVKIKKGQSPIKLPKKYLGFPVFKVYESQIYKD